MHLVLIIPILHLRTLKKVNAERQLICLTHNIKTNLEIKIPEEVSLTNLKNKDEISL